MNNTRVIVCNSVTTLIVLCIVLFEHFILYLSVTEIEYLHTFSSVPRKKREKKKIFFAPNIFIYTFKIIGTNLIGLLFSHPATERMLHTISIKPH